MIEWAKVACDIHSNPKIRKAGGMAREVFIFVLLMHRKHGANGVISANYVEKEYLADMLQVDVDDACNALQRCYVARLLTCNAAENTVEIVGFDDEWRNPLTPTERSRKSREKQAKKRVQRNATHRPLHATDATPREEKRREDLNKDLVVEADAPPKKAKAKKPSLTSSEREAIPVAAEVFRKLEEWTGRKYKSEAKANLTLFAARMAEGATVDDFKAVVWHRGHKWADDPKMNEYLRPSTLFCRKHWDEYLAAAWAAVAEDERESTPAPSGPVLAVLEGAS